MTKLIAALPGANWTETQICKTASVWNSRAPGANPNHTQLAATGGTWNAVTVIEATEGGVQANALLADIVAPKTGNIETGFSWNHGAQAVATCSVTSQVRDNPMAVIAVH